MIHFIIGGKRISFTSNADKDLFSWTYIGIIGTVPTEFSI